MQAEYQEALLSTIDAAVITTDENFTILYLNKKANELFGGCSTKKRGLKYKPFAEFVFQHESPAEASKQLKLKGHWQGKLFYKKEGRHLLLEVSVTKVTSKKGECCGYLAYHRPIYEGVQPKNSLPAFLSSENKLKAALEKEHHLNEMKNRFVSMASHEFRTPLSTILSSIYLMEKYETTEQQMNRVKHAEKIKECVHHMNALLEDLLSIGKLEEGKVSAHPATLNLVELISETIGTLDSLKKKGQQIVFTHKGTEAITSDKKLLRNIISNLLSNALKFSSAHKSVEINSEVSPDGTRITIKDHGLGISHADQLHLFESFYRGRNAQNVQGTGLGLHIVKRYLEILNGKIELTSELDRGTTVCVLLP